MQKDVFSATALQGGNEMSRSMPVTWWRFGAVGSDVGQINAGPG